MGKRKSSKKEAKKVVYKLPTEFDCPVCNRSKCVEIKLLLKKTKKIVQGTGLLLSLRTAVQYRD